MAKNNKSKFLTLMLAVSLVAGMGGMSNNNCAYASEDKEVVEEKIDKGEAEKKEKSSEEKNENGKEEKSKDSIANVISEESSTLSDDSVYKIIIGYEFKDGSFDPWAEGTGFLITNKDIMTNQTLTDKSSSSSLFKSILKEKQNAYEKVGVSLNDENALKENLKIKVIDNKGEEKSVEGSVSKNGMGVINLSNPESSPVAVFADEDNIENKEGNAYKFKVAGNNDEKADILEKNLTVSKNDKTKDGESFEMNSDLEEGISPIGSPIINDKGQVIGMVSGAGKTVTTIPTNSLQAFLATNGINFSTASNIAKNKDKEDEEEALKQAREAEKAAIDTKGLEKAIKEAEKVNKEEYTEESYKALSDAVSDGKTIMGSSDKTQQQIDSAKSKIKKAQEELVVKSTFPIKAVIIGAGVLAFIIMLLVMIKKNKKKMQKEAEEKAKKEREKEDEIHGYSEFLKNNNRGQEYVDLNQIDVTKQESPRELRMPRNTPVDGLEYADPRYDDDHVGVLNNQNKYGINENPYNFQDDGADGTTLLSGGYLIRKDNGKQITIFDGFIIGKEKKSVNYCVVNNPTVSRNHIRISVINNQYFVEDLESKNYTYVNGKQIPPYQKVKLENGYEIRISNVSFTFYDK